jgi:hypothetical protein
VADQYVQRLPALGLSIERNTPAVPPDGRWHLIRDDVELDTFRTLKAAQEAWRELIAASGWTPPKAEERSAAEMLEAERWARDRDARNEYWHSGRRKAW